MFNFSKCTSQVLLMLRKICVKLPIEYRQTSSRPVIFLPLSTKRWQFITSTTKIERFEFIRCYVYENFNECIELKKWRWGRTRIYWDEFELSSSVRGSVGSASPPASASWPVAASTSAPLSSNGVYCNKMYNQCGCCRLKGLQKKAEFIYKIA